MAGNPATVDEDQVAARTVPQQIVEAWARNDADAFAALFTDDATMILPNDIFVRGRDAIRAFMAAGYAGPYRGTRVTGQPVSAKFFADGAGVLVTEGGVLAPGETEVAPERAIRATWVLARRDGRWLITAYQNTPVNG